MDYLVKDPNETFPVSIDYTGQLPNGYTLDSAVASAIDKSDGSDATNIILLSPTCSIDLTEEQVICVLTGGIDKTDYEITITTTLVPSGTLVDCFTVAVREC